MTLPDPIVPSERTPVSLFQASTLFSTSVFEVAAPSRMIPDAP